MTKNDYKKLSALLCVLTYKHPLIRAAANGQELAGDDEGQEVAIPGQSSAAAFEECERRMDKWLAERQNRPTRETLKTLQKSEKMKERGAAQVALMNEAKAKSGNVGGRPKKVKP
jgi:hypothetical protein